MRLSLVTTSVAILGCLLAVSSHAADAPPFPTVSYRDGYVTVQATGAPRADVVASLAREARIAVRGDVLDTRPVYKTFTDVALGDALDRLLGKQNFLLVYDDAGRPRRLELLGLEEVRPAPPRTPHPLPPRTVRPTPTLPQASHRLGSPPPPAPGRR